MRVIKDFSACLVYFPSIVVETSLNSHLTDHWLQISTKIYFEICIILIENNKLNIPKIFPLLLFRIECRLPPEPSCVMMNEIPYVSRQKISSISCIPMITCPFCNIFGNS
jgi:hypothetical protein